MKRYEDFLFELKKLEPKGQDDPKLVLHRNSVQLPLDDDVIFMTVDEIKQKYDANEIEHSNIDDDICLDIIIKNFNKLKIMYDPEFEFNKLYFEHDGEITSIEIEYDRTGDEDQIWIHFLGIPYIPNNTKKFNNIVDKYVARDGKNFILNLYQDSTQEENPLANNKSLMNLFRGYNVQKMLFDMGKLDIINHVGFNKKLLAEHPDIKKQVEWG